TRPKDKSVQWLTALSGQSETLVVGVYWFSSWIYELAGARHALLCFATHVEARSAPEQGSLYTIATCLSSIQTSVSTCDNPRPALCCWGFNRRGEYCAETAHHYLY